jgi:hypothetical protein
VRVVREFGAQEVFHSSCDSRRLVPTRSTALSIRHPRTATAAKEAVHKLRAGRRSRDDHGFCRCAFKFQSGLRCIYSDSRSVPASQWSSRIVGCDSPVVKAGNALAAASGLVSFSPKFDPSCPARDLLPLRFCFDLASLQFLRSTPPPPPPIPSQITTHNRQHDHFQGAHPLYARREYPALVRAQCPESFAAAHVCCLPAPC